MSVFDRKVNLVLGIDSLIELVCVLVKAEQACVEDAEYAMQLILKTLRGCNGDEHETTQTQPDKWQEFHDSVIKMNQTYELPVNQIPTLLPNQAIRTQQFIDILNKEIDEGYEMLNSLQGQQVFTEKTELDSLTELADWYGDMVVYIMSEAIRNGIPLMEVLQIIMESNMTKLGEDCKPIKDKNDKFLKGPNFVAPEPAIKELLSRIKLSRLEGN